ncbi:hypothetical protein FZ103_10605 [Streptomonospora sp. PA3]|uniref:helix-turn-helix domain-containing protein n=1 Tax=Streptomonospora sp. PA3 TaxID=2607326 RepID=UPI0012DD31A5|nr:helix-turn-helix domain-containing protein [Streptomonospora sp. PA3]MUL41621.1 hypothetical protein [Streptomonospora sp. PA3]
MNQPPEAADEGGDCALQDRLLALVHAAPGATLPMLAEEAGLTPEEAGPALARLVDRGALSASGPPGFTRWHPPADRQAPGPPAASRHTTVTRLVISYLDDHPGCRVSDIAAATGQHRTSVYKWLRVLMAEGRAQRIDEAAQPGRGSPGLWRLVPAEEEGGGLEDTDRYAGLVPSERVLQCVVDHPHSTTTELARILGPAVPVAAHLTRLHRDGAVTRASKRSGWRAQRAPIGAVPAAGGAPPRPTSGALASALRQRAAAVETEADTRPAGGASPELRAALLRDFAAAIDAMSPTPTGPGDDAP